MGQRAVLTNGRLEWMEFSSDGGMSGGEGKGGGVGGVNNWVVGVDGI